MKNECNVAKDLMPLCIDGVASEESQQLVDEHIKTCRECAELYAGMHDELPACPDKQEEKQMDAAARRLKNRRVRRAVLVGVIGMLLGIMIFLVVYNADEITFRVQYVHLNGDLKEEALFARVSSLGDDPKRYIHLTSTPSGSPYFQTVISTELLEDGNAVCLQVRAVYKGLPPQEEYDAGGIISMGQVREDVWVAYSDEADNWLPVMRIELLSGDTTTVLWNLGEDVPTQSEADAEERMLMENLRK